MKRMLVISGLIALTAFGTALKDHHAKCTGSKYCNACKNCNYCGHCAKNGGTCGVCK